MELEFSSVNKFWWESTIWKTNIYFLRKRNPCTYRKVDKYDVQVHSRSSLIHIDTDTQLYIKQTIYETT